MSDGRMVTPKADQIVPGVVVRLEQSEGGTLSPFSDSVVLSVSKDSVKLARPYLYATSVDTACPNWLMGTEKYEVSLSRLLECFLLVVNDRGTPHSFVA